jgi:hypothetical protein
MIYRQVSASIAGAVAVTTPPPLSPPESLDEVERSDEEPSLPDQESRSQPSPPELPLELVPETSPPALSGWLLRFCTRFRVRIPGIFAPQFNDACHFRRPGGTAVH